MFKIIKNYESFLKDKKIYKNQKKKYIYILYIYSVYMYIVQFN